ncbi:MAG: hypothetical protein AAGL49_15720, partial [Pseudomonadota bacterium]
MGSKRVDEIEFVINPQHPEEDVRTASLLAFTPSGVGGWLAPLDREAIAEDASLAETRNLIGRWAGGFTCDERYGGRQEAELLVASHSVTGSIWQVKAKFRHIGPDGDHSGEADLEGVFLNDAALLRLDHEPLGKRSLRTYTITGLFGRVQTGGGAELQPQISGRVGESEDRCGEITLTK